MVWNRTIDVEPQLEHEHGPLEISSNLPHIVWQRWLKCAKKLNGLNNIRFTLG